MVLSNMTLKYFKYRVCEECTEGKDCPADCSNGSGGLSCCTSSNQCGAGEGDCDSDADCSGNLKCGQGSGKDDNCDTTLGFPATYDCCYPG